VIAQRVTTVRDADQILVFGEGAITQRGTHDELLGQDGFYRELYDLQMRDQDEAQRAMQEASARLPDGVDAESTVIAGKAVS